MGKPNSGPLKTQLGRPSATLPPLWRGVLDSLDLHCRFTGGGIATLDLSKTEHKPRHLDTEELRPPDISSELCKVTLPSSLANESDTDKEERLTRLLSSPPNGAREWQDSSTSRGRKASPVNKRSSAPSPEQASLSPSGDTSTGLGPAGTKRVSKPAADLQAWGTAEGSFPRPFLVWCWPKEPRPLY